MRSMMQAGRSEFSIKCGTDVPMIINRVTSISRVLSGIPLLMAMLACCSVLHAQGTGLRLVPGDPEREARDLAAAVIESSGGLEIWNNRNWNISFEFVVERNGKELSRFAHQWKRATNEYTVTGKTREGQTWQVHFNDIYAKQGTATVDGNPAHDTLAPQLIDMAYARFINDSYWLLMPFKLLDPGVIRRRLADTTIGGRIYNVLHLSFQSVGLTPGDQYWLYIEPGTKRIERWHFQLQSGREGEYLWQSYQRRGPLKLSLRRVTPDGSAAIIFENVRVDEGTNKP